MTATQADPIERSGSASGQPDVRLEGVTKVFGQTVIVNNLALTIECGEFFSLLGPSGCGKTTTLNMIGGFDHPSAGAIYLGGADVSRQPSYKRDVNTVFQSYALFPHLDIFENVAFGLRRKGVARGEIDRAVREMLALVNLDGLEKRQPRQLSGGQQQRVALARALVNKPKLLLLDEPLGALDLKLRKQMQLELKRIQIEVGITFLYVTHDQEEAMVMSDRLAVMVGGQIDQVGRPDDVYDNPSTEFVAGFLGASNLIAGEVSGRDGELVSVRLENGDVVRINAARLGDRGPAIKVGVRPEKIEIEPPEAQPRDGWNSLDGTVETDAYIGVSHQYAVIGPGERRFTVYTQNLGVGAAPRPGDRVRLVWHPRHTFAIETSS